MELTNFDNLLPKNKEKLNTTLLNNKNTITLVQKCQSIRKLGEYLGVSHSTISSYLKTGATGRNYLKDYIK